MRQNVVGTAKSSAQLERNKAFKALALQAMLVAFVAFVYSLFSGKMFLLPVLFGGLSSVLPSFLFASLIFTFLNPKAPKQLAVMFFIGEMMKLLISAVLLATVIVHMPGFFLPAVVGFFTAWLGNWLSPIFFNSVSKN